MPLLTKRPTQQCFELSDMLNRNASGQPAEDVTTKLSSQLNIAKSLEVTVYRGHDFEWTTVFGRLQSSASD